MRFSHIRLAAVAALALFAAACANRTGDNTIAEYCADPGRANYDICKQHRDVESVRGRVEQVFGVATDARQRADRAQATADQAMARDMTCTTHTLRQRQVGSCSDPGYTLTSCVQTRYTTRAGGLSILRSINDTECRFNTRVLEMQVRCCHVGPDGADTLTEGRTPRQQPAAQQPVS
ncbi:MAG: hypothetical protein HXY28_09145 [Hydrogenophilaceae bacterium]|jgi:hypothetical protein|nr:hypothetical protein [Hydrogenophilaceae bacterium]